MKVLILSIEEATARNNSKYHRVRYVTDEKKQYTAVCFESIEPEKFTGNICDVTVKKSDMADKIEKIE